MKVRRWLVQIGLAIITISLIAIVIFPAASNQSIIATIFGLLIFSIGLNLYLD